MELATDLATLALYDVVIFAGAPAPSIPSLLPLSGLRPPAGRRSASASKGLSESFQNDSRNSLLKKNCHLNPVSLFSYTLTGKALQVRRADQYAADAIRRCNPLQILPMQYSPKTEFVDESLK